MSSTRLAREVEQKTKQAQKMIQMLKEKREKKKKVEGQTLQFGTPFHQQPLLQPQHNSKGEINLKNDSLTENNNCLAQLYSKIFNNQMDNPNMAASQLEQHVLSLKEELQKITQEGVLNTQMLRRDLETKEKEKNQMAETNNQLNKDIHDLKQQSQMYKKKCQLQQAKNKEQIKLNMEYEQKIKEVTQKLQSSGLQLKTSQNKNKDNQILIKQLQEKCKAYQKNIKQTENDKQQQVTLIQSLRREVQDKKKSESLTIEKHEKQNNSLVIKQNQIATLKEKHKQQINGLTKQIENAKGQLLKKDEDYQKQMKIAMLELKKKDEQLQKIQSERRQLEEGNWQVQQRFQKQNEDLRQQLQNAKLNFEQTHHQLQDKVSYFQLLSEENASKLQVLEQQKQEVETLLKQHITQSQEKTANIHEQLKKRESTKNQQISELQQKCIKKENQLKEALETIATKQQLLNVKNRETTQLTSVAQSLSEELIIIKKKLGECENQIQVMKIENTQLINANAVEESQKPAEELNQSNKQSTTNLICEIEELNKKVISLQLRAQQLESEKGRIQTENISLKQQNERNAKQSQQEVLDLKEKYDNIYSNYNEEAKKAKELQDKLNSMRSVQVQSHHQMEVQTQEIHQVTVEELQEKNKVISELSQKIIVLEQQKSNAQLQIGTLQSKMVSMVEEKSKESAKHIKTIQQLTQQLNETYRKVNQQTRLSKGKNEKRNSSKDVNKFRSIFGFGSNNQNQ